MVPSNCILANWPLTADDEKDLCETIDLNMIIVLLDDILPLDTRQKTTRLGCRFHEGREDLKRDGKLYKLEKYRN